MAGPIRPDEVTEAKTATIPEAVFQVFNELIARNWTGHSAIVKQDDVVQVLVERHGMDRDEIFRQHLLDVEGSYRQLGWVVIYDKPAYNESGIATFTFSKSVK